MRWEYYTGHVENEIALRAKIRNSSTLVIVELGKFIYLFKGFNANAHAQYRPDSYYRDIDTLKCIIIHCSW
jgi:hypothetical protein